MRVSPRGPRRAILASLVVAALAPCCSSASYPVYDPSAVRAEIGRALGCDPEVIRFLEEPPGYPGYLAQGCGHSMAFDCTEDAEGVHCLQRKAESDGEESPASDDESDTDDGRAGETGGCGCGHLFGGHHAAHHASDTGHPAPRHEREQERASSSRSSSSGHRGSGGCGCGHFSHDHPSPAAPTKR